MPIKFNNTVTLLIAVLFLFMSSCTNNSSSAESKTKADSKIDLAYKAVMAVHDEVMPEMGTIHRLRKQIGGKIHAGVPKEEDKEAMVKMMKTLDVADEGMMSWMAEFKMPKKESEEKQLEYLKSEQAKIDKVSKEMFGAIEEAEKLLGID
ncbi:MAG: hypothetical protein ACI8YQ_000819 [Polaribacter sp.]|jgi:hypothetical protein